MLREIQQRMSLVGPTRVAAARSATAPCSGTEPGSTQDPDRHATSEDLLGFRDHATGSDPSANNFAGFGW